MVAAIGVLLYYQLDNVFEKLFSRFTEQGMDFAGRDGLYAEGLELFSKYPFFGVGFDYKSELYFFFMPNSNGPSYYHSTLIQILASFGLFGGLFYFYLYYWRYRVVFTDLSSLKFAIFIGMLMFETYNIIDTNFFQPQGYVLLLFISLMMEKSLDKSQTLPLIIKGFDCLNNKRMVKFA